MKDQYLLLGANEPSGKVLESGEPYGLISAVFFCDFMFLSFHFSKFEKDLSKIVLKVFFKSHFGPKWVSRTVVDSFCKILGQFWTVLDNTNLKSIFET